jgi:membrane protein
METVKKWIFLFRVAAIESMNDRVPMLGAAIAYYTMFSLAPFLLIALAVAALFFGETSSKTSIFSGIYDLLGNDGGQAVESMVSAAAKKQQDSHISYGLGILTIVIGASGVFQQLYDALNVIWKIQPDQGKKLLAVLRQRFLSFAAVASVIFVLLISLIVSAWVAVISQSLASYLSSQTIVLHMIHIIVSIGVTGILFAAIFKILTAYPLKWREVWFGAMSTSVLFNIGKSLIGIYLGKTGFASAYGAVGSIIVVLIWIFYSAGIFLYGAELMRAHVSQNQR